MAARYDCNICSVSNGITHVTPKTVLAYVYKSYKSMVSHWYKGRNEQCNNLYSLMS